MQKTNLSVGLSLPAKLASSEYEKGNASAAKTLSNHYPAH